MNGKTSEWSRAVARTTDGMQQSTGAASNTLGARTPAAIRVGRRAGSSSDVDSSRIVNPPRYDHDATTGVKPCRAFRVCGPMMRRMVVT